MNIVFKKDRPCRACQAKKQVESHHHAKYKTIENAIHGLVSVVTNTVLSLLMIILVSLGCSFCKTIVKYKRC
jgi:hypothetical protein